MEKLLTLKANSSLIFQVKVHLYLRREKDKIIGGINSLCFSLIHCEYIYIYIYTKVNLTLLIDYNFI